METLTGVLIDVSGSMKDNAVGKIDEKDGEWGRSIFEVIDNFVRYDVPSENHIFAIGVGAKYGRGLFDIIKTVEKLLDPEIAQTPYDNIVEDFFELMEQNGAHNIRKWATRRVIKDAVSKDMAVLIFSQLKSNKEFLKRFVKECLPNQCTDVTAEFRIVESILQMALNGSTTVVTTFKKAKKEDIQKVVKEAESLLLNEKKCSLLEDVGSVFPVQRASSIIHGPLIDKELISHDRIKQLMEAVEPYIYGRTPLYETLEETVNIFSKLEYSKHKKLLFVVSDGEPTDNFLSSSRVFEQLKDLGVIVVCCLITRSSNIQPKKLYSIENEKWNKGGKFLFRLSSSIPSQLLPRTIFTQRKWSIDIFNNETKLFLQINHPDNIHDVCDLVKNVVCCQDSLSDLLVSVSLDIYINQSTYGFKAQLQVGGTCYANASAAVLHLAMKRILGRDEGYPDFNDLREKIVKLHGTVGANTLNVLEGITPEYRLHCKIVDAKDAMKAIVAKRPVVATFCLTDIEWNQFSQFYRIKPTGVLTKAEIDLNKRDPRAELKGHAVVLTSFNSECLRFMNSWGDNWADMGFFRVQNSKVLDFKFIDVFWTLNDLSKLEIEYFTKHGADVANKIMKNLTGLQKARYECPICTENSLVTEFSGSLNEAVCPKCKETFRSGETGNILALNMYLTSLSK